MSQEFLKLCGVLGQLNNQLDDWDCSCEIELFKTDVLKLIAIEVEKAYKQGAIDNVVRFTPTIGQEPWLIGIGNAPHGELQLDTIASLYAKERGLKP